ncbi:hypothetical protein PG995_011316 [Apiospora arundinis]|uniref:DUF221-domain-containing protein n=1 Tax=Apiospora arundinis TaxID=335852 RepID=A0ABR2IV91_9PEZI
MSTFIIRVATASALLLRMAAAADMSETNKDNDKALASQGITLIKFVSALATSLIVFGIQAGLFLLLRNKLARIFKPKTYLVPERERTEPPPDSPWGLISALMRFKDREIMKKCGLDAYFFLRYLQTLLIVFIPMALVIIPILVPINYHGGRSQNFDNNTKSNQANITGFDTLAWGNVSPKKTHRYWAHLVLAIGVILWVCGVFFAEMKVFVKIRQDWLTTAEHRLRASATTVLVSAIPEKWLTEEALLGLFDVFPGGIRNIWLTRDFTALLEKIEKRDKIHKQLEEAQTELIRAAKKSQLKKRDAEEKKARKQSKLKAPTKEQRAERQKEEDAAAKLQAEFGGGDSSGDTHEVPHSIQDGLAESHQFEGGHGEGPHKPGLGGNPLDVIGTGFSKIGQGLGKGIGAVGKTGQGIWGGAKNVVDQVDSQIETTNGFVSIAPTEANMSSRPPTRASAARRIQVPDEGEHLRPDTRGSNSPRSPLGRISHSHNGSIASQNAAYKESIELKPLQNNTVRKAGSNLDDMYDNERARWFEFWKPPAGGFASPIPQGYESLPSKQNQKSTWQKVKAHIPFLGGDDKEPFEYPKAYNEDYEEEKEGEAAEWEKWLRKKDRPTHRLAKFEWTPDFLPTLPLINKKVDTIYWCRGELARLNLEIETDQQNPEQFPLMRSAFIQFNHQVAAHMACQSVIHHIPRHMAPRVVEISPNDVIWENMAITWWAAWLRTGIVFLIVAGMVILWAIPVSLTSSISQVTTLIDDFPWLSFLEKNETIFRAVDAVTGVLPALLLALLLWLVPVIMELLAHYQGAKTGAQKSESIQTYYFVFLFFQVFLVVSFASGTLGILTEITNNPANVPDLLAKNLPGVSNYFFSYMILQALSTSSGTLLQIGALINWYIIARIFSSTARSKWETNTTLPKVKWGSYFPVYTNFACIALVYSVIAPVISIFAIITFALLWVANRYSMIYVNRLALDTGGVLYPRAINQTFTGLYVMEICLIGLFFLVRDEEFNVACLPQAIIMIVCTFLTVLYQFLLNSSFGPMFRYLPITFEDEAVLRDDAFQRAQERRLGLLDEDDEDQMYDKEGLEPRRHRTVDSVATTTDGADEKSPRGNKLTNSGAARGLKHAGSLAVRGGKVLKNQTYGRAERGVVSAAKYREQRRKKDLEAQRAIGEALYGGFHDEIEDLTPEERDTLVRRAFTHSALRARRPTVWIPHDDIGVSEDEIKRTREFSEYIWISNEGTALDSKVRVVYGRPPPDFSELDLINL